MSWFSGSRPAAGALPLGHRSEALRVVLDSLPPESRHSVLDLGPPLAGNIKVLAGLSCRVRIADLHRSLSGESLESRQPEAMGALLERLLPLAPDERFDALFAWDVLDYLRPDQVSSLMARLTPACRPGALALVMVSTRRQIAARPARYRIVDRDTLSCDESLAPLRTCPQYTQLDLVRMMPGFSVRRSFLLRNGIQEYLFACGAQATAVPVQRARAAPGVASERTWFRRGRR